MGSVKIGRPVSQHRPLPLPDVGGPPDVAEHGEVLRAPGGTVVVVTAIGTGAAGGEDGADGAEGVVLWVVGDPRKGKCDMVFSPPGMLDRRSLLVTVSIIHFAVPRGSLLNLANACTRTDQGATCLCLRILYS